MITVTINEKDIQLEKPVTILDAAKAGGVKIPTLCYFEGLEKFGGCRLCLVEVEKLPKLQTACTVMVTDGMVVKTETDAIVKARRAMLEFLLINHPLDCPYCDKAGECELQDLVAKYGPDSSRFQEGKRLHPESFDDPIIVRNMERCILCTRCVRMCDGVQGAYAIAVTNRGSHSFIEPFSGGKYECEYCGNCLTVCPVGAIMSRLHRHSYRPWFVEREVQTVCGFCGVGCSLVLQMRENTILRAIPKLGIGINSGLLCAKGRFGYDFVETNKKLTAPLVREHGELKAVSWDEALSLIARRLGEIKEEHGGKSIAGIASPRCTNEDNYVFQRFFREVLSSNNIDSISRVFYAPVQVYLESLFGQGITANIMSGIANSDAVIVVGGDPVKVNPILGLQIRAAHRNGARVVSLCSADGLRRFSNKELIAQLGTENLLYSTFLKALIDMRGLPGRLKSIEEHAGSLKWPKGKEVQQKTGLEIADIEAAVQALADMQNISVIIGPDILATSGFQGLFLIALVGYVLDARFYLLSERPNEQGVVDMGCLPDTLTGSRPIGISSFRNKFEQEMGYSIPPEEGLSLFEMFDGMAKGQIKAAYVMGDNPVFNLPAADKIREAFARLDFLVVQDAFLSETAQLADVVLPAAVWSEKNGTYVNLERRIQKLTKAKNSLGGMEDWLILTRLARLMGSSMNYESVFSVWEEIIHASHLYGPLGHEDLETDKALWPYKGEPLRGVEGEVIVPEDKLSVTGGQYPVITEKSLFHSGTLSRYSPALNDIQSEPFALIGKAVEDKFGLHEGDKVKISSDGKSLELLCKIDNSIKDSRIQIVNVFEGVCVGLLMDYEIEPVTKAAVLRIPETTIEKV